MIRSEYPFTSGCCGRRQWEMGGGRELGGGRGSAVQCAMCRRPAAVVDGPWCRQTSARHGRPAPGVAVAASDVTGETPLTG